MFSVPLFRMWLPWEQASVMVWSKFDPYTCNKINFLGQYSPFNLSWVGSVSIPFTSRLRDTEKQRQCRHDDTRLTEWKRQKRAATRGAYRVANQWRMAASRALEWIGASKARLVFRYEISELNLGELLATLSFVRVGGSWQLKLTQNSNMRCY